MRRVFGLALAATLCAATATACGSAGNDVPSGGTGSNANVGGGATVVARPTTSAGVTSPGQGSGSTLGSSTPAGGATPAATPAR